MASNQCDVLFYFCFVICLLVVKLRLLWKASSTEQPVGLELPGKSGPGDLNGIQWETNYRESDWNNW